MTQPLAVLTRSRDLSANQSYLDYVRGNTVHFYDVSGSVEVRVGQDRQTFSLILSGDKFSLPDGFSFNEIEFREIGGSSASVFYRVSDGDITNTATQITDTVEVRSGTSIDTPALITADTDGTAFVLGPLTKAVLIQNHHATDYVWVGDSNVGNDATPRGIAVGPKSVMTLAVGDCTLYARRGGSNDITVTYLEVA